MSQLLELEGVSKVYGKHKVLSQINLSLVSNRIIGLFGRSGSGKTTLLKVMAGLEKPTAGRRYVQGKEVTEGLSAQVVYVPQSFSLPLRFTVKDSLNFFADFYPDFSREQAQSLLERWGISLNLPLSRFYASDQSKIQLALLLSRKASLYLLDNPFEQIDSSDRQAVFQAVMAAYQPGTTLIFAGQFIPELEPLLDQILFMKDGQLHLQGEADDLSVDHGLPIDQLVEKLLEL